MRRTMRSNLKFLNARQVVPGWGFSSCASRAECAHTQ